MTPQTKPTIPSFIITATLGASSKNTETAAEINFAGNGIHYYYPQNVADINLKRKNPARKSDQIIRWRETARNDLISANWLYSLCEMNPNWFPWVPWVLPYNWVYLIAFDSIEKALKTVMIACGIDYSHLPKQHDICGYIKCLVSAQDKNWQLAKFKQFEGEVEKVQRYYYRTRWPNLYDNCYCYRDVCIPMKHFYKSDAYGILCLAQSIIDKMDEILNQTYYM